MTCPRCDQDNPETAVYCSACGEPIHVTTPAPTVSAALWRRFIGPRADYYLNRFALFQDGMRDRYMLTWHWPAFLVGWLWYLYRKMYLHAGVFLFGGLLPMAFGAGLVGVVIWNVFAALAANFLYYMHVKLSVRAIERQAVLDAGLRDRLLTATGGIQPYVWWLGFGLLVLAVGAGLMEAPSGHPRGIGAG